MTTSALEIEVFDGAKPVTRGVFDQTKIILGRISSADFRINDPRVSRIHALLERLEDGSLRLTDLASTHGSFVNGERIVERIISPKDEIRLGELKLRLAYTTVEATLPPTAPVAAPSAPASPAPAVSRLEVVKPNDEPARPVLSARPPPPPVTPREASPRAAAGGPGLEPSPSDPAVRGSREATVIRSLKETARTRGVLDPAGPSEDLEITVYWQDTILDINHFRQTQTSVTVGEAVGNTYVIPARELPPKFELVRVKGPVAELRLHPSIKGSARVQGKMENFDDLRTRGRDRIQLSGQDIAKVQIGTVNFFLMFVPEPPAIPKAPVFDQGKAFWALQVSFAAAALLFITLGTLFRDPIQGQVKEFPEKYRKIIVEEFKKHEERKTPPPPPIVGDKPKPGKSNPDAVMADKVTRKGGNEGEGARERGTEGKRGTKTAKHETGITNRPKVSPNRNKVVDAPVRAKTEGILSALKNTGLGTKLARLGGTEGGAQGNDPLDKALLGTGGGGVRSGRGSGGSGLQGSGTGGGGTAVGVGGLGSKGLGGGARGDGEGSLPGKGEFAIGTESGGVIVLGGLTREEIARVVNAHASEIALCYQQELQKNPSLFGKVNFKWTVNDAGSVTTVSASENQTGSRNLEACMRTRIARWKFPTAPAGASSNVEWPWIFKPKGT